MQTVGIAIVILFGLAACQCDNPIDFQHLNLDTQYNLSNGFSSNKLNFNVLQSIWDDGNPSPNGVVTVQVQAPGQAGAGGSGQNLNVNNANVQLHLGPNVNRITMDIGYWGGNRRGFCIDLRFEKQSRCLET